MLSFYVRTSSHETAFTGLNIPCRLPRTLALDSAWPLLPTPIKFEKRNREWQPALGTLGYATASPRSICNRWSSVSGATPSIQTPGETCLVSREGGTVALRFCLIHSCCSWSTRLQSLCTVFMIVAFSQNALYASQESSLIVKFDWERFTPFLEWVPPKRGILLGISFYFVCRLTALILFPRLRSTFFVNFNGFVVMIWNELSMATSMRKTHISPSPFKQSFSIPSARNESRTLYTRASHWLVMYSARMSYTHGAPAAALFALCERKKATTPLEKL